MTTEETIKPRNVIIPEELPLIALKNAVLFPQVVIPLIVQRPKSVGSLNYAMAHDRLVFFVAQKNTDDDVGEKELYAVGTVGRIISVFRLPDGSFKIDVEGLTRVKIVRIMSDDPFFKASIVPFPLEVTDGVEERALLRRITEQFRAVSEIKSYSAILPEVIYMMSQLKNPEQIISLVAANLTLEAQDQQKVMEAATALDALRQLNFYLTREGEIVEAEKNLARETKKQIGKMQKEIFLREQLKSIEKELGVEDEREEFNILKEKITASGMPKDVESKAMKELSRLGKMPSFNPEVSYLRTYLDWLVEIPWSKKTKDKIDLTEAEKILDEDHYGLKKVKERVLEYLAVQKQVGKLRGPIMCLVGPPGTGKTSVGQSIARALGRKFIKVSLGGIRDEAEIRGHRRTYVGAMPGRIVQGIHNAKAKNPVFMLDEIDKIGIDFRGDPSSALLEALDPEQNHAFSDHYLEVPYDLSEVMFIATANVLETIPPALRDRLEVIEFPGYTELEKLHIAKGFLLPKLYRDHGLTKKMLAFQDGAIADVIQFHTREAGVRNLERELASIVRKVTRKLVDAPTKKPVSITRSALHTYLGPVKFSHQVGEKKDEVGVVTGLGWTPVGGEVFAIEATKMPGTGKLNLTGHLGMVMKESAQAAMSFARAYAANKGVTVDLAKEDIHIHAPSGAIRKDGPSAGIAITTSLVSLFLGRSVRRRIAMTGEVTLRGKVMEIGGVKEKVLAAHRAGVKMVILPADNKKDLEDIPAEIRKDLQFMFVHTMEDVVKVALK